MAFVCAAVLGGLTTPGCAEFDTEPAPIAQGTLGEEIFQVFCEGMAREVDPTDVSGARWKPVCAEGEAPPADAPPRLVALHQNRARLVDALDRTLPSTMGDDLGLFMGELLPFFDRPDERLPTQTRQLADFLIRLSADDAAIESLERLGTREGYRPLRLALGVTRPTLAYPEFDAFADLALATLIDGAAQEEFTDLQRALAVEMATLEAEPPGDPSEQTTLALMRELMFTEDDRFAIAPDPQWVLLRDDRGMALPNTEGGALMAPFVDLDGDGLADIDDLGRFTDAAGGVLDVPTPFRTLGETGIPRDPSGRSIRSDGTRYYSYIDANRTMLSGMTAEMAPWFDADAPTLMQMSRGLPVLMGPSVDSAAHYGDFTLPYSTFDTQSGPLFDAIAALGEVMHRPQTDDALLVTERLLRDHESQTAGVMRAARYIANESDLHPDARLEQPSLFWDDLIALLIEMSHRPGMLEALMRSFSDPRSAGLGEVYASFMRHRDRVTYSARGVNATPDGLPLDERVSRSMPDTFDNESLFQRTLLLIDGLNGVRVCNRDGAVLRIRVLGVNFRYPLFGTADACEIIAIDNVAEAYARSILGTYELEMQSGFLDFMVGMADTLGINVDTALEEASGIDGLTRHPTPQALNRLVFWGLSDPSGVRSCTPDENGGDCNGEFAGQIFDPIVDRHGNDVIERYHGTIFAWEIPGFYEGMQPMLEALHQPGYTYSEGGDYFFGELLATMARHWPSREHTETCGPGDCRLGDPNFSYQSNVRSYEELVANGFDQGALTERLQRMNVALESIEVRPGVDGVGALAAAAEQMIDPRLNPGLTDRRGRSTTTVNDGSRDVPMTPLYMLLDALNAMDAAWESEPDRRREWLIARRAMGEQFLGADTLGDGFRMRNQRAHAILLTALPFFRERIAEHRARGDLLEWSTGLDEQMADTMREPLVSALIRFLDAVNEDPEARAAMAGLMAYLVDEASANDAFASTLYGLADSLMVLEDDRNIVPLLNALSEAMAPNVREVVAGTDRSGQLDVDSAAVRETLVLMRDIQAVDERRTLRAILQNAVSLPETGDAETPLETIVDVIAEVHRASPNAGGRMAADDYRSVIGNVTDFMLDEHRGLERLNLVVQSRSCFPEQGRACASEGSEMTSSGLCYEGASCTCSDNDGALEWNCAP